MMRRILSVAAIVLAVGPAHAGVYEWQTVSQPDGYTTIAGRMDLKRWAPYEFHCRVEDDCDTADPDSPVASFSFAVDYEHINIEPQKGYGYFYAADVLISAQEMRISDGAIGTWFVREGDLWKLKFVQEGYVYPAIMGRWVRVKQQQVPIPGSLALFGCGALLLALRQRGSTA